MMLNLLTNQKTYPTKESETGRVEDAETRGRTCGLLSASCILYPASRIPHPASCIPLPGALLDTLSLLGSCDRMRAQ
jgi:hypothetical protein